MNTLQDLESMVEDLRSELEAASGKRICDTVLYNVKIVDVYSERIYDGSVAIHNGRIIAVNPDEHIRAHEMIDGKGQYAVPGFIDAHAHIETTLLTPMALGDLVAPWGTT